MDIKKVLIFNVVNAFKHFAFVIITLAVTDTYAQKNPDELKTNENYINIIKYYRYLNPDSALFFTELGLQKAIKEKDELGQAALLNQYGMILDNAMNYQEARQKYIQSEAIYRRSNDEKGLASTLVRLGVVEKRKGNLDKALAYYIQALKLNEKNKNKSGILEARIVLSEAYFSLNDLESCLENLQIAEKIDKGLPSSNFSLNMYISYGNFFIKIKRFDKAIEYIEEGLSKSNKVEYNGSRNGLLKLLGSAYLKKGDRKRAITIFNEALSFAREINNVLREQSILVELAEVYEKTEPDTALEYLNEALAIVSQNKMYRQEIVVLNKIGEVYKRNADFEKALSITERSYQLSEEVYYKEMSKQISNLETAYELEKSNAQLSVLQLKNNKQTMVRNIVLSIAVAITLLFAITLAYFYKSKHLNKLLQQANHKLAESNDEKDKFFSIIAHDIRSPLASTIGVLRLIAGKELDEETQVDVVNKLALHCESSLEILDKLLRWGQMQIKGTSLDVTKFQPHDNVNENVAMLKDAADHKNIEIVIDIPEHIVLEADSNHFDFVVRNLLANAIKFTPIGGQILLNARMRSPGLVCFSISDNGVGISQKRIDNLFKLSSIGTKGTSSEEGTSLGLLICKQFITANNGTISVESELGKGATFTFTLPGAAAISG